MGIVTSLGKAMGKGAAKKTAAKSAGKGTAKAAPKKVKPKYKDYKWDAGDIAMAGVTPVAVGAELTINTSQAQQLEKNRATVDRQKYDTQQARKNGKPVGADKFSWAGRR